MSKRLFKTMVAVLAIAAAAAGPVRGQNASPDVILDFTDNSWGIPAGKANITYAANSYTSGDYTITLQGGGGSSNGYYFNAGYLMLGKTDAYLELPEFESAVDSIVVVGNSGASGQVVQNIYVGGTAVSTQTTGATGTNTYVINENYRAAGNIYTLKVGSAQNTQITYIKVYYVSSGGGSGSENPTKYTSAVAMSALQVGDTLAEGFSLTGNESNYIYFVANRHKHNENLSGYLENISLDQVQSIGANCVFSTLVNEQSITFAPVDENGRDGDAWVVTEVESIEGFTNITIAGITIPVLYTVTFAEGTEDVDNWDITPAEAATNTGVTAGTVVTVKYNGTRRINSIEAMVDGPSLTTPLTIEALTAGTIVVNISGSLTLSTGMKYAVNGGEKTLITTTTTIPVNAGDKVQFYGNGTSTTEYGNNPEVNLRGTAETKVYGNIMSLLDETGYETATAISGNYVFYGLFRNNAYLKDASGLLLPATTLANDCYSNMFHDCTGLTEAPVLPAPTLVSGCYNAMFYGCNNLASVTCLATSGIDASGSTSYWLEDAGSNVTGTKTFNAVSTATWPGNYNGIPEGWTRQAIGAQSTPEPVTLVPTGNTNEWTLTMPADNMLLMVNYAPAPTLHTVRFAEGMSGWQVQDVTASASATAPAVLQNVMAGDSLVVTAPDALPGKVKSVKAVKYVAPAATVTTEPAATGATIEAGSTAALVNAGAASGGTMMYAVTTTNAQPASTADFSASVPTAEGRSAGTYYVWYYVEGDASHTDSEISATAIAVTIAAAETTVTWTSSDMTSNFYAYFDGWTNNNTHQGITVTASGDANSGWGQNNIDVNDGSGTITFTSSVGNIKSIVISAVYLNNMDMSVPTGWTANEPWNNPRTLSWSGTASATVNLPLSNMQNIGDISTIVFTLE